MGRHQATSLLAVIAAAALMLAGCSEEEPTAGTFSKASTMGTPRAYHAAVRLKDGRVLVVGGASEFTEYQLTFSRTYLRSAEVFDPKANQWTAVSPMSEPRGQPLLFVLPNGNVIAIGSTWSSTEGASGELASCEIYDVPSDRWDPAPAMRYASVYRVFSQLADGRVFAAGGPAKEYTDIASRPREAEVYDWVANAWIPIAPTPVPMACNNAFTLPDGNVFLPRCAVEDPDGYRYQSFMWDPTSDTWEGAAPDACPTDSSSFLQFEDGQILQDCVSKSFVYLPAERSWRALGTSEPSWRWRTPLLHGRVLLLNMPNDEAYETGTSVFDPWSGESRNGDPMPVWREANTYTTTLLTDGRVLIVGGKTHEWTGEVSMTWHGSATADIFTPQ